MASNKLRGSGRKYDSIKNKKKKKAVETPHRRLTQGDISRSVLSRGCTVDGVSL